MKNSVIVANLFLIRGEIYVAAGSDSQPDKHRLVINIMAERRSVKAEPWLPSASITKRTCPSECLKVTVQLCLRFDGMSCSSVDVKRNGDVHTDADKNHFSCLVAETVRSVVASDGLSRTRETSDNLLLCLWVDAEYLHEEPEEHLLAAFSFHQRARSSVQFG